MLLRLITILIVFAPLLSAMELHDEAKKEQSIVISPLTNLCLKTISNHEIDSTGLPQHYKQLIKEGLIRQNGVALWAAAAAEGKLEAHQTCIGNSWRENPEGLMAISADDSFIVIASFDNTAKVWNLKTGELVHSLAGHNDSITSVAIAPDDSYIVTGSRDTTAKLWDTKTGKCLCTFSGHNGVVTSVAIIGSQKTIVTGSLDRTAKVWDGYTGKLMYPLVGHTLPIDSVFVLYHDTLIGTKSFGDAIKIWDAKTGQLMHTFEEKNYIHSLATSMNSEFIVTADGNISTKVWNAKTGALTFAECSSNTDGWVPLLALSRDGSLLVTAGFDDGSVKVCNIKTGDYICKLDDTDCSVMSVAISPDTKFVAKGSLNKVKVWDRETGKVVHTFSTSINGLLSTINPKSVKISNKGNFVIANYYGDQTVRVWDIETGKLIHAFKDDSSKILNVEAKSSDGSFIARRCETNCTSVEVCDAQTGMVIRRLGGFVYGHADEVTAIAISPDNTFIVTGARDKTAMLWDAKTGRALCTHCPQVFGDEWEPICSLTIDPSNTCITIGSAGLVYLWKISGFVNPLLDEKVLPEDVLKTIKPYKFNASSKGCSIQ